MSVARVRAKVEKKGTRGLAAVNGAATRGAAAVNGAATRGMAYAKEGVDVLATHGQRLTRRVDGRIKRYTGRRSAAWIDRASRLVKDHLGMTFTVVAALGLFVLLV